MHLTLRTTLLTGMVMSALAQVGLVEDTVYMEDVVVMALVLRVVSSLKKYLVIKIVSRSLFFHRDSFWKDRDSKMDENKEELQNDEKVYSIPFRRHLWPEEVALKQEQRKVKRLRILMVAFVVVALVGGWLLGSVLPLSLLAPPFEF